MTILTALPIPLRCARRVRQPDRPVSDAARSRSLHQGGEAMNALVPLTVIIVGCILAAGPLTLYHEARAVAKTPPPTSSCNHCSYAPFERVRFHHAQ